jgi:hypothetical protein
VQPSRWSNDPRQTENRPIDLEQVRHGLTTLTAWWGSGVAAVRTRARIPAFERDNLMRRHILGPLALVTAAIALGPAVPWASQARADRQLERAAVTPIEAAPPVVASPAPPSTEPAPTSSETLPPTTTTTTPTAPVQRFPLAAYSGLGAWLDVYDWSASFAKYGPAVEIDAIDAMAAQGVQTLFIQASKWDAPEDVLDRDRLLAFITRAHQHGIAVVGWYLPTLEDVGRDLQRLLAIADLPIQGIAVDIEARNVGDVAERNRRLVELSTALRTALPGEVIGAIPLEPVLMEDVNPHYWPGFPWAEIAPSYDVWLPMAYWTNRKESSPWRNSYVYTLTNIDRIRTHIGQPDAPVHVLGGIGDKTTAEDLIGFRIAAGERAAIGGSIYDFRTTLAAHWPELLPFRDLRR